MDLDFTFVETASSRNVPKQHFTKTHIVNRKRLADIWTSLSQRCPLNILGNAVVISRNLTDAKPAMTTFCAIQRRVIKNATGSGWSRASYVKCAANTSAIRGTARNVMKVVATGGGLEALDTGSALFAHQPNTAQRSFARIGPQGWHQQ